jgi:hypothetical protein
MNFNIARSSDGFSIDVVGDDDDDFLSCIVSVMDFFVLSDTTLFHAMSVIKMQTAAANTAV